MIRLLAASSLALVLCLGSATPSHAVAATQTVSGSPGSYSYTYTYDSTAPTNSDVANWTSGWGATGITGWDYVGTVSGASGVYLGNGYVLTAGHVGTGDFMLGSQTYNMIAGSTLAIGTADLHIYRIDTTSTTGSVLSLPALTLSAASNPPSALHSSVVFIGYGGSHGETWGQDTVNYTNQTATLTSPSFVSNDFYTIDGTTNSGPIHFTNDAQVVPGDSGGGAFIYNSSTHLWELAGLNEVQLQDENGQIVGSGFVQLNTYSAVIQADMALTAPEPSTWLLLAGGTTGLALLRAARRARV